MRSEVLKALRLLVGCKAYPCLEKVTRLEIKYDKDSHMIDGPQFDDPFMLIGLMELGVNCAFKIQLTTYHPSIVSSLFSCMTSIQCDLLCQVFHPISQSFRPACAISIRDQTSSRRIATLRTESRPTMW